VYGYGIHGEDADGIENQHAGQEAQDGWRILIEWSIRGNLTTWRLLVIDCLRAIR